MIERRVVGLQTPNEGGGSMAQFCVPYSQTRLILLVLKLSMLREAQGGRSGHVLASPCCNTPRPCAPGGVGITDRTQIPRIRAPKGTVEHSKATLKAFRSTWRAARWPSVGKGRGGDSGLLLLWQVGGVGLQGNAEQPPPGCAHGSRRQAQCEASSWCLQACRGWGSVSPCGQPDLEKAVPATWP